MILSPKTNTEQFLQTIFKATWSLLHQVRARTCLSVDQELSQVCMSLITAHVYDLGDLAVRKKGSWH